MDCHQALRLFITDEAFTIAPDTKGPSLVLDRDAKSNLRVSDSPPGVKDGTPTPISGIYGIITLVQSDYLVLIKSARKVSTVLGADVFTPTAFSIFPVSRVESSKLLADAGEAYLLSLLKSHLRDAEGKMFFTYTSAYDVTSSLQRQQTDRPLWQKADERFFWNKHFQSRLIDLCKREPCGAFILPVMFGFFELRSAVVNSRQLLFGIVSRRSRHRAGTRYFSRGVDNDGSVSNFNETEMLLFAQDGKVRAGFLQTRGSVPVFWAEINNLRYKPDLQVMELDSTAQAFKAHFESQIAIYGDQYLVNLVNTSGYEKPVKDAYERAVQQLGNPSVHYTYFDFHHECKGLRFDRVQGLIDKLEPDLISQGYYFQANSRPAKRQTSVVRTNCMDCLDRTNVVQSAIAKWMLTDQLRQAGVLGHDEIIDTHRDFMFLFRNVWADNADAVSKSYSGTGALKTDFTRFGFRSKRGALQDGVNSAIRYFKNNFTDGPRQDAFDLVTGSWRPHGPGSVTVTPLPPILAALLYVLAAATLILACALLSPAHLPRLLTRSQWLALSLSLFVSSFALIMAHGVEFVNGPKLHPLTDQLGYKGPGQTSGKHGRGFGLQEAGKESKKRLD